MRLLVDECTGPSVARWLVEQGHDVYSVFLSARGTTDDQIIARAFEENRILITNDKDFGEKVFREAMPHRGVILLRLSDERSANKIRVLNNLLARYVDRLQDNFVVATETGVRFVRSPK